MSINQYWATKTPRETVSECVSRATDYYRFINERGLMYVWLLVYLFKHTATERGTLSMGVGEYSEFQQVQINEFRNLLNHKVGIIKNQRAVWEPMAVNDDVTSLAQTKIAKSILEMYTNHKGYDHKFNELVTHTVDFGEAFALQTWDSFKGKKTHTLPHPSGAKNDDGTPQIVNFYEGDVDMRIYQPVDVIRDCYIKNQDQNKWYIFRDRVNKWDLAAKHPELYDQIVSRTLDIDIQAHYTDIAQYQKSPDLVQMFTFVHEKTAALPNGRIIQYIDEDIILSSTELNYDEVPYHRMIDTAIPGQNFSYTDAFDMLTVEDLTNGLWSTIITNQRMFGVQNIIMPKGSDISESDIMGGMNVLMYDAAVGEPKALQLLETPKEIFESLAMLRTAKNLISGVNSTAQGNPPNDVSSGVAISMLQGLNVQYSQGAQGSYIEALTSVGTALINILKKNAKTERLIEYTGTASRSLLDKFTGNDINSIARVIAKPGNPLSQTIQGRFTIAEMLIQAGQVSDVHDLLEVLETGSLDILTEGAEMQLIYAQQENEELRQGTAIQVHPFDDHVSHLRKHISLISDLSVRRGKTVSNTDPTTGKVSTSIDPNSNPQGQKILSAVSAHIMEHVQYLKNPDIAPILQMFGYQSGQPQGTPQGPGGPQAHAPAQTPQGTIKVAPSPAHGAKLPPAAASQQPTTVAQAAGNLEAPVGMIPTAAITTAHKASKPSGPPTGPVPHRG